MDSIKVRDVNEYGSKESLENWSLQKWDLPAVASLCRWGIEWLSDLPNSGVSHDTGHRSRESNCQTIPPSEWNPGGHGLSLTKPQRYQLSRTQTRVETMTAHRWNLGQQQADIVQTQDNIFYGSNLSVGERDKLPDSSSAGVRNNKFIKA